MLADKKGNIGQKIIATNSKAIIKSITSERHLEVVLTMRGYARSVNGPLKYEHRKSLKSSERLEVCLVCTEYKVTIVGKTSLQSGVLN